MSDVFVEIVGRLIGSLLGFAVVVFWLSRDREFRHFVLGALILLDKRAEKRREEKADG